MQPFVFEIENMRCAYGKRKEDAFRVLTIKRLVIPQGKVVFFVGPSGIGKSTILEVLGFMNDTVVRCDRFNYYGEDMRDIWTAWNDKRISEFRNKEFTFIFQDNNLMPNFSAYENVMITALFQGKSRNKCLEEMREIFPPLSLPFGQDRPIQEFSGGQRQRLAFARAMLPDSKVLFGDEPTGNLDRATAEDVMKMIEQRVHTTTGDNTSAIIVSHDMRLATRYADIIVRIRRKMDSNGHQYGIIDSSSFFEKDEGVWFKDNTDYTDEELVRELEDSL